MESAAPATVPLLRRILGYTVVRLLVGILVVGVPAGFVSMGVHALALPSEDAGVVAAVGIAGAGVICYLLYVKYVEQRRADELDGAYALKELAIGVGGGTLLLCLVVGVLALLGDARIASTKTWNVLVAPFAMAVSSGVYEELLMRGILFRVVERPLGTWLSLAISAAFFGAAHLANPGASFFTAAAISLEAGIMLAAAYMATRRLWVPIGIHVGLNFAQGGLFGIAVSGNPVTGWLKTELSGPEVLSGGPFGAEGSLVAVLLCLATGVWLVRVSIQRGNIIAPMWVRRRMEVQAAPSSPGAG
jgi:membrane protease YdiL (CAAX protease family)